MHYNKLKLLKKNDEIKLLGWNMKTVLINGELKIVWGMRILLL